VTQGGLRAVRHLLHRGRRDERLGWSQVTHVATLVTGAILMNSVTLVAKATNLPLERKLAPLVRRTRSWRRVPRPPTRTELGSAAEFRTTSRALCASLASR